MEPGRALDVFRRKEQRVGQVVHQDRDPDAVDRLESDRVHEVKDATRRGSMPFV